MHAYGYTSANERLTCSVLTAAAACMQAIRVSRAALRCTAPSATTPSAVLAVTVTRTPARNAGVLLNDASSESLTYRANIT